MHFFLKIKRDFVTIYMALFFIKFLIKKQIPSCLITLARMEQLESNISSFVSKILFNAFKKKYRADDYLHDPYFKFVTERFNISASQQFLHHNVIVLKPYISEKEKGLILVKYTEVINALPFLFNLEKIQQRYHMILEPSTESPYQLFNKFFPSVSLIFIQSLSKREISVHSNHGFIPVPLCAGDWVNEKNFYHKEIEKKYDFCVISNFRSEKRYPFLLNSLKNHWKGDLKFAIVASKYIGNGLDWIENLLKENNIKKEQVDIYSEVDFTVVNTILNQSYCHVLCSKREGANKASFESMISGTPALMPKHHIGFPYWRFKEPFVINYSTGKEMVDAIKSCTDTHENAQHSIKAKELTGSRVATHTLNEEMKKRAGEKGEVWTLDILRKVNNVHANYYDNNDVQKCTEDFIFLEQHTINGFRYSADEAVKIFSRA